MGAGLVRQTGQHACHSASSCQHIVRCVTCAAMAVTWPLVEELDAPPVALPN